MCTKLKRVMLAPEPDRRDQKSNDDSARVLAAVLYVFARSVLVDLNQSAQLPKTGRLRDAGRVSVERISPLAMTWQGLSPSQVQPMARMRQFLDSISHALVRQVLEWAPPVVGPPDRRGHCVVLANHVSAVCARYCLPALEPVVARTLTAAPVKARPLPAVCASIVALFEASVLHDRVRLAGSVEDVSDSMLLTGYSRAQVFRLRAGHE